MKQINLGTILQPAPNSIVSAANDLCGWKYPIEILRPLHGVDQGQSQSAISRAKQQFIANPLKVRRYSFELDVSPTGRIGLESNLLDSTRFEDG